MSWSRRSALALVLLALGACGFRPMYATYADGAVGAELSQIYVAQIDDRIGQQVRNRLLDLINPRGQPRQEQYRLIVRLRPSTPPRTLSSDELASRRNFRLIGDYALYTADGKTELTKGTDRAVASYNIVDSEFGTIASLQSAERLTAQQLAENITTRVALYFTKQR